MNKIHSSITMTHSDSSMTPNLNSTMDEWMEYLLHLHSKEIDLGLERLKQVAENLQVQTAKDLAGVSSKPPTIITIAGTNGKGSTAAYIEAALMSHQQRVGVYSSPHFNSFNERVRIQGEPVQDALFIDALVEVQKTRGNISLSFFEFTTLAALETFKRHELDFLILEVGLGGRLDAVNIVDPDIAVVTSIGLDHEAFLGNDLNQIAFEKASIARPNKPLVVGETKEYPAFVDIVESTKCQLLQKEKSFDFREVASDRWVFTSSDTQSRLQSLEIPHVPRLPLVNLPTALQVLSLLDIPFDHVVLAESLVNAQLTGRFQKIEKPRAMVLDVAHNPDSARLLNQQLTRSKRTHPVRIAVLGMLSDKDVASVVRELDEIDQWCLVSLPTDRGLSAEALAERADLSDASRVIGQYASVEEALNILEEQPCELIVLGSFVTITEALAWSKRRENHG